MNPWTKKQKGSESRDAFKFFHKNLLDSRFYALNSDLELVEKYPVPFIVARLDFKLAGDSISFAEAIAYNQLVAMPEPYKIPVYIIEAQRPFTDVSPETHRFNVWEYEWADWKPDPPIVNKKLVASNLSWEQLGEWERQLREARRKLKRWLVADALR